MNKAFTLIELMVTVAIVAILVAIAVPLVQIFVYKAKRTEGVTILEGLRTAETAYFSTFNTFPVVGGLGLAGSFPPKLGYTFTPAKYYIFSVSAFSPSYTDNCYETQPDGSGYYVLLRGQLDRDPYWDVLAMTSFNVGCTLPGDLGEIVLIQDDTFN